MDWKQDIKKGKKEATTFVFSARIPLKYKKFLEDNDIDNKKLIMRACEELDETLKGVSNP